MIAIELRGELVKVGTTRHAVLRWIQRVDPTADYLAARRQLLEFMGNAKVTRRSPRWLRDARPSAGAVRYALNAATPKVAAVVTETGYVLTVRVAERRRRAPKTPNTHHDRDRRRP